MFFEHDKTLIDNQYKPNIMFNMQIKALSEIEFLW